MVRVYGCGGDGGGLDAAWRWATTAACDLVSRCTSARSDATCNACSLAALSTACSTHEHAKEAEWGKAALRAERGCAPSGRYEL